MSKRPIMLLGGMVAWLVALIGFQLCAPSEDAGSGMVVGADFAVLEAPSVRVAFRGIEPRRLLAYTPEEGAERDFEVVLRDTTDMRTVGELLASVDREASFRVRGKITDVHADGSFRWEWKVRKTKTLRDVADGPMALRDWERAVKAMKGLSGWSTLAPSGVVLDSNRPPSPRGATAATLATTLDQILNEPGMPLPAEPVGEGCVWEVTRRFRVSGVETVTTERLEVASEREGSLKLVMSAGGEAGGGTEGWIQEVTSFTATGGGEWELGLTGALPVDGSAWSDQAAAMEMSVQGIPLSSESTTKTDLVIRPL